MELRRKLRKSRDVKKGIKDRSVGEGQMEWCSAIALSLSHVQEVSRINRLD